MSMSKDEASSALHDIEATERRSRTLFGYGVASPYLLLWGALWIVAGAADVRRSHFKSAGAPAIVPSR